jgi:hypothetical protein
MSPTRYCLLQKDQYPIHLATKSSAVEIVEMLLIAAPETLWVVDTNKLEPFKYAKTPEVLAVFVRFYMWRVRKGMVLMKQRVKLLAALPQPLFRSALEYL